MPEFRCPSRVKGEKGKKNRPKLGSREMMVGVSVPWGRHRQNLWASAIDKGDNRLSPVGSE